MTDDLAVDTGQHGLPASRHIGRFTCAMLLAGLVFGWPHPAFPAEEPAASTPQLQFAPVGFRPSFGGNIDYLMRRDSINGQKRRSQALNVALNAGIDVNSFIWQPWFAQVSGGMGVSTYLNETNYNAGGANTSSNKTVNTVVTGRAALDVVPLSRFPFRAHYQKDDNRQNVGFGSANSATQTTRYGLSQRYSTLSGQTSYMASYERSRWDSVRSGVGRQRQAGIEMATALSPNQNLSISGTNNLNEHSGSNQSTLSNTLVARHSYRPVSALSVQNLANAGKTNYRLTQGENVDKYLQLSNFTTWNSDERPLTVTGSARISETSNGNATGSAQQSSANANLGASYQLNPRVRTYANAGVSLTDDRNSGTQAVSTSETAGAQYQSEMTELGKFRYGTHANGNISNSNTPYGSSQGLGLSAGHGLNRSSTESRRVRTDAHIDQSVSVNKYTNISPTTQLIHSGSLTWTIAGDGGTTGIRLNASDSRTLSAPRGFFQLVNLQATRTQNMTRNNSLDGNLTIQSSRQGTSGTPSTPATVTSSASVNYAHRRVFNVPRLNFSSEVRFYSDSLIPLAGGPQDQTSRSWGNHLAYSIGRLNLMADANWSESNHVRQSTLMFRLNRTF